MPTTTPPPGLGLESITSHHGGECAPIDATISIVDLRITPEALSRSTSSSSVGKLHDARRHQAGLARRRQKSRVMFARQLLGPIPTVDVRSDDDPFHGKPLVGAEFVNKWDSYANLYGGVRDAICGEYDVPDADELLYLMRRERERPSPWWFLALVERKPHMLDQCVAQWYPLMQCTAHVKLSLRAQVAYVVQHSTILEAPKTRAGQQLSTQMERSDLLQSFIQTLLEKHELEAASVYRVDMSAAMLFLVMEAFVGELIPPAYIVQMALDGLQRAMGGDQERSRTRSSTSNSSNMPPPLDGMLTAAQLSRAVFHYLDLWVETAFIAEWRDMLVTLLEAITPALPVALRLVAEVYSDRVRGGRGDAAASTTWQWCLPLRVEGQPIWVSYPTGTSSCIEREVLRLCRGGGGGRDATKEEEDDDNLVDTWLHSEQRLSFTEPSVVDADHFEELIDWRDMTVSRCDGLPLTIRRLPHAPTRKGKATDEGSNPTAPLLLSPFVPKLLGGGSASTTIESRCDHVVMALMQQQATTEQEMMTSGSSSGTNPVASKTVIHVPSSLIATSHDVEDVHWGEAGEKNYSADHHPLNLKQQDTRLFRSNDPWHSRVVIPPSETSQRRQYAQLVQHEVEPIPVPSSITVDPSEWQSFFLADGEARVSAASKNNGASDPADIPSKGSDPVFAVSGMVCCDAPVDTLPPLRSLAPLSKSIKKQMRSLTKGASHHLMTNDHVAIHYTDGVCHARALAPLALVLQMLYDETSRATDCLLMFGQLQRQQKKKKIATMKTESPSALRAMVPPSQTTPLITDGKSTAADKTSALVQITATENGGTVTTQHNPHHTVKKISRGHQGLDNAIERIRLPTDTCRPERLDIQLVPCPAGLVLSSPVPGGGSAAAAGVSGASSAAAGSSANSGNHHTPLPTTTSSGAVSEHGDYDDSDSAATNTLSYTYDVFLACESHVDSLLRQPLIIHGGVGLVRHLIHALQAKLDNSLDPATACVQAAACRHVRVVIESAPSSPWAQELSSRTVVDPMSRDFQLLSRLGLNSVSNTAGGMSMSAALMHELSRLNPKGRAQLPLGGQRPRPRLWRDRVPRETSVNLPEDLGGVSSLAMVFHDRVKRNQQFLFNAVKPNAASPSSPHASSTTGSPLPEFASEVPSRTTSFSGASAAMQMAYRSASVPVTLMDSDKIFRQRTGPEPMGLGTLIHGATSPLKRLDDIMAPSASLAEAVGAARRNKRFPEPSVEESYLESVNARVMRQSPDAESTKRHTAKLMRNRGRLRVQNKDLSFSAFSAGGGAPDVDSLVRVLSTQSPALLSHSPLRNREATPPRLRGSDLRPGRESPWSTLPALRSASDALVVGDNNAVGKQRSQKRILHAAEMLPVLKPIKAFSNNNHQNLDRSKVKRTVSPLGVVSDVRTASNSGARRQ